MSYNTYSNPSDLRITDIRFVDIDGAPKRCTLIKIMTNQGIEGYGEVRDASTKTYAAMLKSRLIGENPCDVDRPLCTLSVTLSHRALIPIIRPILMLI